MEEGKNERREGGREEGKLRIRIVLGSKITADGDCSHEIKRHLLFRRKVMTNLDSTFKNKGPSIQGYSFSSSHVWM